MHSVISLDRSLANFTRHSYVKAVELQAFHRGIHTFLFATIITRCNSAIEPILLSAKVIFETFLLPLLGTA